MKKLTWNELTAKINKSTDVAEINRLCKKRSALEIEIDPRNPKNIDRSFEHDSENS